MLLCKFLIVHFRNMAFQRPAITESFLTITILGDLLGTVPVLCVLSPTINRWLSLVFVQFSKDVTPLPPIILSAQFLGGYYIPPPQHRHCIVAD